MLRAGQTLVEDLAEIEKALEVLLARAETPFAKALIEGMAEQVASLGLEAADKKSSDGQFLCDKTCQTPLPFEAP